MKGATVAISTLGDTVLTLLQVNAMSQIPRPLLVLTPKQEENLQKLKKRLSVPFNGSLTDHQVDFLCFHEFFIKNILFG